MRGTAPLLQGQHAFGDDALHHGGHLVRRKGHALFEPLLQKADAASHKK